VILIIENSCFLPHAHIQYLKKLFVCFQQSVLSIDGFGTLESVCENQMKRPVACIIVLQLHELYSHNRPFPVAYLLKPGRQFLKQKAMFYCS